MATSRAQEAICSLVKDGILELETKDGSFPLYNGVVVIEDMLLVIEENYEARNLQLYRRDDGKLLYKSHRLENIPTDVCLISKTEVAVCVVNGTILILSFKSVDDVKLVKTLHISIGFIEYQSVAKLDSDKLVVSGANYNCMFYWCVVNLTDGRVDSTHKICKGVCSHLAIKYNSVYISCCTEDSTTNGVYAYNIFNPHVREFLYQHDGWKPGSLMADNRNFIFVSEKYSSRIHQLTRSGQLVTIHTVSSILDRIFYDDQHEVLYTTSSKSNMITLYRMEYSHQTGVPAEILNMDHKSIQLFEEALKDGKETVHSIRVMVVGHIGVGKTTLVKRLLGKEVNISERCSTEGIDVYVNCCDVSLSTYEWTRRGKDSEKDYQLQRLARILNEQQSVKDKVTDEEQLIIPPQGEITVKSREEVHVAVEDKEVEVLDHRPPQQDSDQDLSFTANRQGESLPALVQRKLTQSENNTLAMLKLLQENAYNIKQDTGKTSPLTVWDFAGQFACYTTHQTFLTRRAIYLLVSDVSEQLTDLVADECYFDSEGIMKCKVHDLLEVWLNLIHSCATSHEAGIPPVILVGTHVDQILQRYRHEICERYFRAIRSYLSDKPTRFHLVDEDFPIDNTVVDSKLEDLKRKIVEVASKQPYWGERIPARWLPLEQDLRRLKAAGVKVIPRSMLDDLNKTGAVQISADELDLFLRFHHDMGMILCFSIDILREKIVLDPQWMIDALKSLITAEMFVLRSSPAVTDKWIEFKKKGKLSLELVDAVWTKEKHQDLHDNKEHILLLMEQLNIIAKLRIYSEEALKIKEEDYFLAPCMLRQKTPREVICPVEHPQMESSSVLCYVFVGKYLPSPIFHRLLAACVAYWPIATKMNNGTLDNLIFCGCCVFQLDHYHKLTIHFRDYIIFMRVTRKGISDKTPSTKLCIEVRQFVTATLIKIIGYLGQSLKFECFIQCPEYNGDSVNSLIPVSLLKQNAEVCCVCHDNIIKSDKLLKFWFEDMRSQGGNEGKTGSKRTSNTDIQDQILPQAQDVRPKKMNVASKLYQSKGVPCSDPNVLCQILNKSQQDASSSLSRLEVNCLSVGLKRYDETPANGNCFFEAVSSQLQRLNCGVQRSPQQLRQEVVAFMRTNTVLHAPEGTIDLNSFIHDETFDDYCTRMARDGEWADHVVVVAMARKLQMDIFIVMSSPSAGTEDNIVWVVGQTGFQGMPILLGHIWESHYLSLQPIDYWSWESGSGDTSDYEPEHGVKCESNVQGGWTKTGGMPITQYISVPPVLVPDLAGHSTQAQTDVPTPTPTADVMQVPASGSTSSTAVGLIQAPTISASPSTANGSTSSTAVGLIHFPTTNATPSTANGSTSSSCETSDILQISISSYATIDVMQTPISESTTADTMQITESFSTTADVMPVPTSPSTLSTIYGLIQAPTTGSTPSRTSITAEVMQTAASSSTRNDVMLASSSGSTTAFMQAPSSVATTTNVLFATTYASTPSTTTGSIPCPSATAIVMQTTTSGSITTNVIQAPASSSKPSTTIVPTPCPTSTSKTANVIQAPASGSTAADILQAAASGSKLSTTADFMTVPSSCNTAGGLLQPLTSSFIPSTTAVVTQAQSFTSTTVDVMQPRSVDDTDRFMHIACLLINVGSRVLRRLLLYHTVTPACTLDQYLAIERIDIDDLRKKKILNKSQMDILFPQGGSTNLGDYDITLLSALLTNIVITISHQQVNMIEFLRDKRNEIFAHAKSVTVNSNDYQTFWNDICRTLEALSKQCGDPDFENEILREIEGIQLSTVQVTSFLDTLQTHPRRMETLERLVQDLISSRSQESNKESDDSDT